MNRLDRFLKNNNCYEDFMTNLNHRKEFQDTDELLAEHGDDAIILAFGWRSSPARSHEFWFELNERWIIFLESYNKNHKQPDKLFEL